MKWIEISTIKPENIPYTKQGYFISKDKNGLVRCSGAFEFRELWLLLGDEIKYILDENDDSEAELAFNAAKEQTYNEGLWSIKYRTYQDYKNALNK